MHLEWILVLKLGVIGLLEYDSQLGFLVVLVVYFKIVRCDINYHECKEAKHLNDVDYVLCNTWSEVVIEALDLVLEVLHSHEEQLDQGAQSKAEGFEWIVFREDRGHQGNVVAKLDKEHHLEGLLCVTELVVNDALDGLAVLEVVVLVVHHLLNYLRKLKVAEIIFEASLVLVFDVSFLVDLKLPS